MTIRNSARAAKPVFLGQSESWSDRFDSGFDSAGRDSALTRSKYKSLYVRSGLKRGLDIVLSVCAIVFFLPAFAVISIALLWIDGFPIYFRHTRIGRDGRSFDCIKFRTMVKDSEERLQALLQDDPARRKEWNDTYKLREDPRIHPLGAILRKSSLDELPQLVNVLKGDMSIVGPRPIVADEIARYRENFLTFASVRPGLTGLWQVSGRSDTSYPERVNLDVQYIRDIGLAQDLWILAKTVWVVIAGRGSV